MENVAAIMEAANSVGAIIALLLVGLIALLWKYGGKIIDRLDKNTALTQQAHEVAVTANKTAKHVADSIVTNHGSKNLGDAVDRLTEWVALARAEIQLTRDELAVVKLDVGALKERPPTSTVIVSQGSSHDIPDV